MMPHSFPTLPKFAFALMLCSLSGCCCFGPDPGSQHLTASQLRSQELYAENSELINEMGGLQQNFAGVQQERDLFVQQLGDMQNQLATANTRLDNLLVERGELKSRYAARLLDTNGEPMLAGNLGGSLPGFQKDALTGLDKFPEAIHFDLGSAELRAEAMPVLREFADQVNSGSANGLRILIVGHTDDQPIASRQTAQKHPTNWHLSTDRADQVITELQRLGVQPERIAAMGYSRFQPLENGTDETSRQRNRRVEMYVVPNENNIAFWDPAGSLQ